MTDSEKNIRIIDVIRKYRDSVLSEYISQKSNLAGEIASNKVEERYSRDDFGFSAAINDREVELIKKRLNHTKENLDVWNEILVHTIKLFV